MLNNAREGEKVGIEGDAYEQVAQACRGARPKIQKWIEEDNGERDNMMGESSFSSLTKAED
jgi:ADP-ribosylation factor-binding protein GGA